MILLAAAFLGLATPAPVAVLRAAKLPAQHRPQKEMKVRFQLQKGNVVAFVNGEKPQVLSAHDSADTGTGAAPLLFADFNLDGNEDVAVLEGNGYGGVNLFYRIWLWNQQALRYDEFKTPVSNPSLNTRSRMLVSGQRSGPRWYQSIYAIAGGKIAPYLEAQMLDAPSYWGITFADGSRAVAHASWFEGNMRERPQTAAKIHAAVCALESLSSVAKDKGNNWSVIVMDFRDEGATVLVSAKGLRDAVWVPAECLSSREEP